jgi:stage V sporulation protein S
MIEVLKVSSRSNPNAVAGALAGVVRASGAVEMQVVGAGALNQAVKAVAIARGYLAPSGIDLVCVPTFADIHIDGERRTAIRLLCEDRAAPQVSAPTVDIRVAPVDAPTASVSGPATGLDVIAGGAAR